MALAQHIEPFYEQLGAKVAKYRSHRRWSQEELGRMLDPPMTRASIAYIEWGRQRVLAHRVAQFAKAFGIPVSDLFANSPAAEPAAKGSRAADFSELVQMLRAAVPEMTEVAAERLATTLSASDGPCRHGRQSGPTPQHHRLKGPTP